MKNAGETTTTPPKLQGAAARIVDQLRRNIDGHAPSGDAFVVSVYGEWGVGKTHCLQQIDQHFGRELQLAITPPDEESAGSKTLPKQIVVPVWFDAWRYEHEPHLVVPLIKTMEYTTAALAQQLALLETEIKLKAQNLGDFGERIEALNRHLDRAGKFFGQMAVAIGYGLRIKGSITDPIPVSIDAKTVADHLKASKPSEKPRSAKRDWVAKDTESLYFNATQFLTEVTRSDALALRFVVLIDDLDRCLPEKAIQVLESVKLFLNVPGFSFVLAVDDEVVERGIAHRYKPYNEAATGAAPPITGAEYLEKIVHLPIFLSRMSHDQAQELLLRSFPALFMELVAQPQEAERDPRKESVQAKRDIDKAAKPSEPEQRISTQGQLLLNLLLHAVPLVPRKLIRACEGVLDAQAMFSQVRASAHFQMAHAARVVLLQQLYPALYRHVRGKPGRYRDLFDLWRDDFGACYAGPASAREDLVQLKAKKAEQERARSNREMEATKPVDAKSALTEQESIERYKLLSLIDEIDRQRGELDVVKLFTGTHQPPEAADHPGLKLKEFAELYFQGVAPPMSTPQASSLAVEEDRPEASLGDAAQVERIVAMLISPTASTRQQAIESEALAGKRLPKRALNALIEAAKKDSSLATSLDWLRDMTQVLGKQQLVRLYREANVLAQFSKAGAQHG